MQEGTVTVGGVSRPLPRPFYVLATQNPIEMEGTYPLPEAQLDRFFYKLLVTYPVRGELASIVRQTVTTAEASHDASWPAARVLLEMHRLALEVPMSTYVLDYAVRLVLATQPAQREVARVGATLRAHRRQPARRAGAHAGRAHPRPAARPLQPELRRRARGRRTTRCATA